jgi:hypothetical protein
MPEHAPTPRSKLRIWSLTDPLFGMALSVGSLTLISTRSSLHLGRPFGFMKGANLPLEAGRTATSGCNRIF